MNWKQFLGAFCAVTLATATYAQYSVNWSKIAGGGGTSTGGVYSVSGTIGQPDAGGMSGGAYSIVGGFWALPVAIQSANAPLLSIQSLGSNVRVYWPLAESSGFVLDQSSAVTGIWSQVSFPYNTNATEISITAPVSGAANFYRLRKL